jgi:ABC-type multidrug transport system ATPase subunit
MLKIRELTHMYPGPVTALKDIHLDISNGMFGLLGPNGAGKTTLMRIVAGLIEPSTGDVELNGINIIQHPATVWDQLGYLPQEFGFYPDLTGEAMLIHLLKLKGLQRNGNLKKCCGELLDRVNLAYAAKKKIKTYSGGMRQRLGIAQALAGNPGLIIVDEPTAGLDPEERLRFYRLLTELAEDRIVLLSTHIVEDVAVLCPRFAVIRAGKRVCVTSPDEAKNRLEGRIFQGSVRSNEMETLCKEWCVTQAILQEGTDHVRIFDTDGNHPPGFIPAEPTLEDAYLVMMQTTTADGGTDAEGIE